MNRLFHFDERRKEKRYPTPSYDILQAIANKFEMLDTNWLFTGQGQMFKVNMDGLVINEPVTDYMTNGHGNAYNEIRENLYKISVPLIPVNAYARYLTDFQENVSEHYETVEFLVN
ncbi:MAG: hypothetical protein ACLFQE_05390, partial [Thermotogota bacterium]